MRLVRHGAICIIHLDDLEPSWAIRNSSKHCNGLVPWRLGRRLVMLLFQWFALVELPSSILNSLSCWLQRERPISLLLWIFHNCEFFLPAQLLNQTYDLDFGIIPSVTPVFVLRPSYFRTNIAACFECVWFPLFYCHSIPHILQCNRCIGPLKWIIHNAQGIMVHCTYTLLWWSSSNNLEG